MSRPNNNLSKSQALNQLLAIPNKSKSHFLSDYLQQLPPGNALVEMLVEIETQNCLESLEDVNLELLQDLEARLKTEINKESFERKSFKNQILIKLFALLIIKNIQTMNEAKTNQYTQKLLTKIFTVNDLKLAEYFIFRVNNLSFYDKSATYENKQIKMDSRLYLYSTYLIGRIKFAKNKPVLAKQFFKRIEEIYERLEPLEKTLLESHLKKLSNEEYGKSVQILLINTLISKFIAKEITVIRDQENFKEFTIHPNFEVRKLQIKKALLENFQIDASKAEESKKKISLLAGKDKIVAQLLYQIFQQKNPLILKQVLETPFLKGIYTNSVILREAKSQFKLQIQRSNSGLQKSKIDRLSQSLLKKQSMVSASDPKKYKKYLQEISSQNKKIHAKFCQEGRYVTKFNFGNNQNTQKFVKMTEKNIMWTQSFKDIDKSPKIDWDNVCGIVYGKVTKRMLSEKQANPTAIFSIITHDRTIDFQCKNEVIAMRFIKGSSGWLNTHWNIRLQQIDDQKQKKNKKDSKLEERQKYYNEKSSNFGTGKLYWKKIFMDLTSKFVEEKEPNESESIPSFSKLQAIISAQSKFVQKSIASSKIKK